MKTVIEDGMGTGSKAKIEKNAVAVSTATEALKANLKGNCYSALCDVTPAVAAKDFFFLRNDDPRDLVIYKIEGWADDASQEITVELNATDDGQAIAAGDVITPINMNSGFANAAAVICASDATDLAVTGGVTAALLAFHSTALQLTTFDFPAGIILATGKRLHCNCSLQGLINMNVYFYFKE